MTDDISKKRVLIYDSGLFTWFAEMLVPHFASVGYYCPWETGAVDGSELIIGSGLDGITRIRYFWKDYKDYDLIVFTDCRFGDLQDELRSMGCRVWGSGMASELELARWKTIQRLDGLGLDSPDAAQVIGTKALREYLQEHERQYVKVSCFRGISETWFSQNSELAESKILSLESRHRAVSEVIPFVVEHEISDALEIGYDGYCIEAEYPNTSLWGIEKKNRAYIQKICGYDDLPEGVRRVNTAITKAMLPGYRQCFHTEIREAGGKDYPLDFTCRFASPAGETMWSLFQNRAEILWNGAGGHLIEPEVEKPYAAQLMFFSDWAKENDMLVQFPEQLRPSVFLMNHCRINGEDWALPGQSHDKEFGSVVALGNTPQEAINAVNEMAEQVHGFDLEYDDSALDKAVEEIEALDKNGEA